MFVLLQNQAPGITAGTYPQQPLPKREISFPPDSVEATIPVLYRRKRICRMDMGSIDGWKIMMSLRSGLLAETTYALDALNVLLFDDTTVPYFGLNQWPGMLDLLLEHFRKNLHDMFDSPILTEPDRNWYQSEKSELDPVDLGAANDIDPDEHEVILAKTPNFTHVSRKELPVKFVDKNEDIFIRDTHKDWDINGDAAGTDIALKAQSDSWQVDSVDSSTATKYILPCFQAEFNNIPFFQHLDKSESENKDSEIEIKTEETDNKNNITKISESESNISEETNDHDLKSKKDSVKSFDKKKKTKTLIDVISRIKKESPEENELKEKVKTESGVKELLDLNKSINEEVKIKTETEDCGAICDAADESRSSEEQGGNRLKVKDVAGTLKRRRMSDYEDECYTRDEASLCLIMDSQDAVARRCVCISNILRNLTFIPGNEIEFAKNTTFLALLGKLLLLNHEHPIRTHKTRNYDREEDADFADSCSSLHGESEWWWDFLVQIRENILVSCANISGHMNLSNYSEVIARPVLDGLLHWAVCPSAHGQDPFASIGQNSLLSPQRLALESLCKLCVTDSNVDLVIATPPFSRLERLCAVLTKHLCRSEDQVLREFSVNLLHYLAAADSSMARVVAMQNPCVSLLVAFIEQAEQSALGVANQHGIGALRENPDSMGTSLDMLRRAAGTLLHLAKHPDNRPLFLQQEQRLLHLVMSQILDQQVAFVIARVLFHISRTNETIPRSENS